MTLKTAPKETSAEDNIITSQEEERAVAHQANPQPQPEGEPQVPREQAAIRLNDNVAARNQLGELEEDEGDDELGLPEFQPEEFFNTSIGQSLTLDALQQRMNNFILDHQQNPTEIIATQEDYNSEVTSISQSLDLIQQAMNKLDQETTNLQSRFRDLLNTIIEDRVEDNSAANNNNNNN